MSMPRHGTNWLSAPSVGWRFTLGAVVVWAMVMCGAQLSDLGPYLDAKLARPIEFRLRELLGRSPALSPKLKIYAVDDATFAALGSWVLSLSDWRTALTRIAARSPRAIVIDAMFSKGTDLEGEGGGLGQLLDELKVPVLVGAFVSPQRIPYRESLSLARPEYRLSALTADASAGFGQSALPPMVDARGLYAYGPLASLQPHFAGIGHIMYRGDGRVAPLVRTSDTEVLGHLSLYASHHRAIVGGRLTLDNRVVPVAQDGRLVVNFPPPARLYPRVRRLLEVLRQPESAMASAIEPDDVVLILPHWYTGNTDFADTPFGGAPAGMVIAGMLNSVITGEWLRPLAGGAVLILIGAIAGAAAAMRLPARWFWVWLVIGMGGVPTLAICGFVYSGLVAEWLLPTVTFGAVGLSVFAEKTRVGDLKVHALKAALDGVLGPAALVELLRRPERLTLDAREQVVTLMFVDVVGFSRLAEEISPRRAFEALKALLARIAEVVHGQGGVIDKTLGDGLLCYFGYRFSDNQAQPDHAASAIRCAARIQQLNVAENLVAAAAGDLVYPLRIGINTASCYLGDLGTGQRLDYTVVGSGVNLAKRLEGACEPHRVLLSKTTYDLVRGVPDLPPEAIRRRSVMIKHAGAPMETYEFDPLSDRPQERESALEAFAHCLAGLGRGQGAGGGQVPAPRSEAPSAMGSVG